MANVLEVVVQARDEASRQLEGISGKIESMKRQLRIAGGIMAGAGAGITAALGMATKAAAEEEAGIIKLATAMKNMGISYDEVRDSLEAWIDAQQQKTAVADDAQRESLATLIGMTGDLAQAQDLLTLAMDMAAGTGKDLSSTTTLLGYALAGNWGMVNRLIPAMKNAQTEEERWAMLRKLFAGQAEAYGRSMAGQMQLLKNNIGDVKEAIGKIIAEAIAPLSEKSGPLLTSIKAWIAEHPQLVRWITLAAAALGMILLPLGTFLIMLPMLTAGIATLTAVSSPWLLIIGAIVVGLGALVAAGIAVYKNWATIASWARTGRDWFIRLRDAITDFIQNALDRLKERLEALIEPFKNVYHWISKVIRGSGLVELQYELGKTNLALADFGNFLSAQTEQAVELKSAIDSLSGSLGTMRGTVSASIPSRYAAEPEAWYHARILQETMGISRTAAMALANPETYGRISRYVEAVAQEAPEFLSQELVPRYGLEQGVVRKIDVNMPVYLDGEKIADSVAEIIGDEVRLQSGD